MNKREAMTMLRAHKRTANNIAKAMYCSDTVIDGMLTDFANTLNRIYACEDFTRELGK